MIPGVPGGADDDQRGRLVVPASGELADGDDANGCEHDNADFGSSDDGLADEPCSFVTVR